MDQAKFTSLLRGGLDNMVRNHSELSGATVDLMGAGSNQPQIEVKFPDGTGYNLLIRPAEVGRVASSP